MAKRRLLSLCHKQAVQPKMTAVTSGLITQLLAARGRERSTIDSAVEGEREGGGSVGGGGGNGVGGGNRRPHGESDAWVSLSALLHAPGVVAVRPVKNHSVGRESEVVMVFLKQVSMHKK
ncbi:hypothetical protein E2C01_049240 [Portunus trituberculatus]|uniref:Uncharacterized protein n=1 Tax=Portunus trituberculatus TaxID=210409 RepID=A0A5B7GDP8_PORTR|nr:hypothetical protein [Portunus trituberculatus]